MPGRTHLESATAHVAFGAVGAGWLVGIAAMAGPWLMSASLAVLVVVLAWGWAGTLGLPSPRGTMAVLLVGGAAILLSVSLRPDAPWLGWLPGGLAVAVIAAFVHQLFRRDGRPRVVESVTSVALALALMGSAALLVPLSRTETGAVLVAATMAAVSLSAVSDLAGRNPSLAPWTVPAALVVGGAGGLVLALLDDQPWQVLVLVGVAAGGVGHAMRSLFAVLPTLAHARPRLVAALASVLVVGVLPYAVALVLLPAALP